MQIKVILNNLYYFAGDIDALHQEFSSVILTNKLI